MKRALDQVMREEWRGEATEILATRNEMRHAQTMRAARF
jgi:hypothetical protein